jgi:hypothetical protein
MPVPGPGGQPGEFAEALAKELAPEFAKIGLKLESMTVQNVSLPEELQKILDQKIGMGMVGNDMGKFMQYQTAQAIPKLAEGRVAAAAALRATPWAWAPVWRWARCWRRTCRPACRAAQPRPQAAAAAGGRRRSRLGRQARGRDGHAGEAGRSQVTQEEFDAKKAELLKKLV